MSDKRVTLYDSTLRDGAQTLGVDFNPADKELIARELDAIQPRHVEVGQQHVRGIPEHRDPRRPSA